MSFIVWEDNGNVRSYEASAYWSSFATLDEAAKFAVKHPRVDGRVPSISEDPLMPAGKSGTFDSYPKVDDDYKMFQDIPVDALISLWKWFKSGSGEWGHVAHWISSALAAVADDGRDSRWAKRCLAVAFTTTVPAEEREQLFKGGRLLEWSDLRPGSRLNPVEGFVKFE